MRQHRGLTETTLDLYQGILVGFREALGDDARTYSAEALRAFVLDRARPHGIYRAMSIVVAVRSLLRFLGATGRCPAGLVQAIPGFASWQLSSIPPVYRRRRCRAGDRVL
jgi:integrase/recombinase XerD